ncbi:unnamed protein product, partial [Didymodactylos carnosus]
LLAARTYQSGTNDSKEHLNFLNVVLDFINTNKHKELYNYANSLKQNYSVQQDQKIEQELFVDLPDDIQREPAVEQAKLDYTQEEIERQDQVEFN